MTITALAANPPAFLRGSQMRVGNGNANGLENAAEHSPALRLCGPEEGDGGGDGDPDPTSRGEAGLLLNTIEQWSKGS